MKPKNIYKMGMVLSLLFGIFPLLAYIVAIVLAKFGGCGKITETVADNCALGEVIHSLFVITWFTIITAPLGVFSALIFYFLYVSVRRR